MIIVDMICFCELNSPLIAMYNIRIPYRQRKKESSFHQKDFILI